VAVDLRDDGALDFAVGKISDERVGRVEGASTLTNSVTVTSGGPYFAVMKRKEASVTPSMGERPMIGFAMWRQKFIKLRF
jgi:hypothetical protein